MSRQRPVSVILADDHHIVRRGLAALLQMSGRYQVVGEACDGEEVLRCAERTQAELVILDLSMPRMNGLETLRRLSRRLPEMKKLVLSMYDDVTFVVQALRGGADGYILKHAMEDELFRALDTILRGERYIGAAIDLAEMDAQLATFAEILTPREREILQLIAEGYTANEIAQILCISPHTANRHRANILQKMGARNQVELVRLAAERGLVILKPPPQRL